eukprot:TRINITY_DN67505_c1_g1_i2.p1 TRINITY_DN67505_c1_g1~~TRINITY_DN67505_c1_g1_i2.p1  ORF type:complete len:101 (-),score=7.78 TRINITY_DN67505_c1_g1_i2:85-387(-)
MDGASLSQIFSELEKVEEVHPTVDSIPCPTLSSFLSNCLCKESKNRWSCEQLLQHPFITRRTQLFGSNVQPVTNEENTANTEQCSTVDLPDLFNSGSATW